MKQSIYLSATLAAVLVMVAPVTSHAFKFNPKLVTEDRADEIYEKLKQLDPVATEIGEFGLFKIAKIRPNQIALGEYYADLDGAEEMGKSKTKRRFDALRKAVPFIHCIYKDDMGNVVTEDRPSDRHHETYQTWYWLEKSRMVGYIHDVIKAETKVDVFIELIKRGYMYTYDEKGRMIVDPKNIRITDVKKLIELMPKTIMGMKDDPYRSLAGMARKAGAFAKGPFFSEFIWANFYRSRIKITNTKEGWDHAVKAAVELSHSAEAAQLPNYLGDCKSRLRKTSS